MKYTLTDTHILYEDGTSTFRNQWMRPETQSAFHVAGCPISGTNQKKSEALERFCHGKNLSETKVLLSIIYELAGRG